jgi:hypothetical protein
VPVSLADLGQLPARLLVELWVLLRGLLHLARVYRTVVLVFLA